MCRVSGLYERSSSNNLNRPVGWLYFFPYPRHMRDRVRKSQANNTARGKDWAMILGFELNRDTGAPPAYLQVVRLIAEGIRRGRLTAGVRLPGSRTLADSLGLHRNTIIKAYAELTSEGWLEVTNAKGTYVSATIPDEQTRPVTRGEVTVLPFELPKELAFEQSYIEPDPDMMQLYGGSCDLRLIPTIAIGRAYRRALRHATRLLNYCDPHGNRALRAELCTFLGATRGLALDSEDILITRGSQMGLYLAITTLLQPRDVVVVEELGYPPAWQAMQLRGVHVMPCRVDEQGLDTVQLARICERQRRKGRPVRAVYVTPHHQYPTTVTMTPGRRMSLSSLAREYHFVVIEDDYCHEFQYEGQPTLPLASTLPRGSAIYVGTLSKVLAPGLRVGFLVAPPEVLRRAAMLRYYIDRQGDAATEAAVAELMEDGEVQRHIRKTRWLYQERRDHCVELLRSAFGAKLEFVVPVGGMALWIRCHGPKGETWVTEARKLGVEFQLGKHLSVRPVADEFVRLGFAAVTPQEMNSAVDRLVTAWRRAERQ